MDASREEIAKKYEYKQLLEHPNYEEAGLRFEQLYPQTKYWYSKTNKIQNNSNSNSNNNATSSYSSMSDSAFQLALSKENAKLLSTPFVLRMFTPDIESEEEEEQDESTSNNNNNNNNSAEKNQIEPETDLGSSLEDALTQLTLNLYERNRKIFQKEYWLSLLTEQSSNNAPPMSIEGEKMSGIKPSDYQEKLNREFGTYYLSSHC